MDHNSRAERRGYYRLRYPIGERPTVCIEDRDYPVSEVSEQGARIPVTSADAIGRDAPFAGVMQFRNGESIPIEGIVLRADGSDVVVRLSKGLSLGRMLAEQIRLRRRYPILFDNTNSRVGEERA